MKILTNMQKYVAQKWRISGKKYCLIKKIGLKYKMLETKPKMNIYINDKQV
jgi:hypothetical protein